MLSVKPNNALRKIRINGRIIDSLKGETIKLEKVPISTKIESLIQKISALRNKPVYLIGATAKSHFLDKSKSI